MKIATFNINDMRKRLANLTSWLDAASPDIVCLQELKATDAQVPADEIAAAGYDMVWRGQTAWNGVAILSRVGKPILVWDALPGDAADGQARYIEAAVAGVLVACLYAPNGNPQPGPKFDDKLAWMDRLENHAADVPAVLARDFNVAPEAVDLYATRSYDDNALIQPESCRRFRRLLDQGWPTRCARGGLQRPLPTPGGTNRPPFASTATSADVSAA